MLIFLQFLEKNHNSHARYFYAILPENEEKRAFFGTFPEKSAIFLQFYEKPQPAKRLRPTAFATPFGLAISLGLHLMAHVTQWARP